MKDKVNQWRLYNQATGYGNRPSDFFPELETDLAKWFINETCLMTGRMIENALNEGKEPFAETGQRAKVKGKYASAPKRKIHKIKSLAEIGIK